MLTIVARITPHPAYYEAARDALAAIVPPTLAEPGCHVFRLHEVAEEPRSLCLYEVFDDAAALDWHLAQPYATEVMRHYETWLAKPIDVMRMHPVT